MFKNPSEVWGFLKPSHSVYPNDKKIFVISECLTYCYVVALYKLFICVRQNKYTILLQMPRR